ncbi:MAG: hypothetical protein IJS13_07335 [Paludibacteraceae bacterium]|nr:hypothetical protein [Paludibacteraceae bacterium]
MQNRNIISLVLLALCCGAYAQSDETALPDSAAVERTVYVEREFQPTIQAAGKIAVMPQIYEPQIVLRQPEYSSFSAPLSLDYNVRQLDFSTLNFRHPEALHGFLEAGVGHANSLFSFNYRVTDSQMQSRRRDKRNTANDLVLDIHADHLAQWGLKTRSVTSLGFDFAKQLPTTQIYFGVNGANDFFSRYGCYYTPDAADPAIGTYSVNRLKNITDSLKQSIWTADAFVGVRSLPNADLEYSAQAGYEAFIAPGFGIEHQIHTLGSFEWSSDVHHVGFEADMQNRFYSTDSALRSNHRIHIEPYYAYEGNRIRLHAGVNLDFSAGKGRVAGISPNIRFEADITQNWFAAYANVLGTYEANGVRGEFKENIYRTLSCLYYDNLSGTYIPVDAEVGFKIRPYATLLMELHAGYRLTLDQHVNVFSREHYGMFEHERQNVSTWRIGADFHYHLRDMVVLNFGGNYYIYNAHSAMGVTTAMPTGLIMSNGNSIAFDGQQWDVHARVDVNINRKWLVYSDNYLIGKRNACVYDLATDTYSTAILRPAFDLNLGVQYNVNRWLSVYAQLNNYLAWTEKLSFYTFYGHEAARANCMIGMTWSF